ncbi:BTAD domain-containing putative transcriptional regulator [Nocardioides sp. GCM10027113]|uniref:AfsR/SARP family transcriptional regulator n=1 Tax=unclassified Nocardioides TaxID=2615069 RepID=UPI0036145BE8
MITIELLGRTTVSGEAGRLTGKGLGGVKPRQLLEMLALRPGVSVSKELLADRLWDGRPPACYVGTVESYVCVLRRTLRLVAAGPAPVATVHGGYLLDADRVQVDVSEVGRLLAGDEEAVGRALDLATGDLLADEPYASWATEAREAFTQRLGQACTRAAGQANRAGRHTQATRLAREALARSPYSEEALRALMFALARTGARAEAVRAYEQMRSLLATDLALGVSTETRYAFLAVLESDGTTSDRADRDELETMLALIHKTLTIDPTALRGIPGSRELGTMLQTLSA